LRDLDNTKIILSKLFVRYLVVKPVCVNATLGQLLLFQTKKDETGNLICK